jgi:hypothetical protein
MNPARSRARTAVRAWDRRSMSPHGSAPFGAKYQPQPSLRLAVPRPAFAYSSGPFFWVLFTIFPPSACDVKMTI